MKDTKRCLCNFSFYNQPAIEEKLEDMAAQGWMIGKPGSLFWTYKRTEPKKLKFAVTYFPGASDFDPGLTDGEQRKADYCAQDGWVLAVRWDVMHIYYNENPDAVPIDTDPVTQVNTIYKAMKKRVLLSQFMTMALILYHLVIQFTSLGRDPVGFLSDPFYFFSIPMWSLLLLTCLYEMISCFIWHRKAKKAADNGYFLPVRTSPTVSYVLFALSILCVIPAYSGFSMSNRSVLFAVVWLAVLFIILFSGNMIKAKLKKCGIPREFNQFISIGSVAVMTVLFLSLMAVSIIRGDLSFSDSKKPAGTYELNGYTMKIYDDPLPLEIEDLRDTGEVEWSKEARHQETLLLSYSEYEQNNIPNGNAGTDEARDLRYNITDVKVHFLFESIKKAILNTRQDEIHGDVVFTDHFEPIDPTIWDADEAYQLHWSGSVLNTYLVCWGSRIAEIKFYWEPTEDEIRTAAEILKKAE